MSCSPTADEQRRQAGRRRRPASQNRVRRADPKTLRVLLIAEAANPEWPSVPLVGWSHVRALSDVVSAHVVTQIRNVPAIERTGWQEGTQFTALDTERIARHRSQAANWLQRRLGFGFTLGTATQSVDYYYFEWLLWRRFRRQLRAGEFDIVHRVTPLSPTTPSLIAGHCARAGVPFVWGPINGGLPWPAAFKNIQRAEGDWLHWVRATHKLLPGYMNVRRNAAAILAGSEYTLSQLPAGARERTVFLPENAVDPQRFGIPRRRRARLPLRVAFVGRLVPYKGADMLIEACAPLMRAGKLVLSIIGDGPQRSAIEKQCRDERVSSAVTMSGWVEHTEVQHHLRRSDVLGFPSIREFGGGVVLEAMALGLVPVIADYGGPADLVTPTVGFRVPLGSREQLVVNLRSVLERMAGDPASVDAMAKKARKYVMRLFTWEAKARQVVEVYRWVLGEQDRPDFGARMQQG